MTVGLAVATSLAGGLGAVLRLLVGRGVVRLTGGPLAAGTFVVNVTGAFALGLLVGATPGRDALQLVGTGLLGGYTTFSTWIVETQRFGEEGAPGAATANIVGSVLAGVAAVWLGRQLAGG